MRRLTQIYVLVLALCGSALAADKPITLEQLRAQADAATGEQCTRICMDAARALVEQSNSLFIAGDVEHGHAAMKDAVHYAQKATEQCIQSRKKQKQTEIALRKLEKRILDVKDTLNFEDKPAVQAASDEIDKFRARILAAMFDLDAPKEKSK